MFYLHTAVWEAWCFSMKNSHFSLWHQVCLLTCMFLHRNREPWQLRQWGSTYSRDWRLSRGEEQINTDTSVFTCVHILHGYIYTPPFTLSYQNHQRSNDIWTFHLKRLCVDLNLEFKNAECVTREKGEPSSLRVKKIFRASSWSATALMGKQWTGTSLTPCRNNIKSS